MLIVPIRENNHPHQKHQENASNVGNEVISKLSVKVRIALLLMPLFIMSLPVLLNQRFRYPEKLSLRSKVLNPKRK